MKIFKVWRPKFLKSQVIFSLFLLLGLLLWGKWVIDTHPAHAVVSWDEGFHGGSALFFTQAIRNIFSIKDYLYLARDFNVGLTWFLPLWSTSAGLLGAILGPSVEVYRLTTLIFAAASLLLIAFFAKKVGGYKAGLIAAATLAFFPTFVIYSHLMMQELPLLFSTSLALILFFRYLTKPRVSKFDIFLTSLSFALGVATKVTAIAVVLGVIMLFGLMILIFFKNTLYYRRYFSIFTILFVGSSLFTFCLFRYLTGKFLNVDLLSAYLSQTAQLSQGDSNIIILLLKTLYQDMTYYLGDFLRMPALAVVFGGSLFAYFVLKRSIIAYFLLAWVAAIYLIFSAVKPHSPQYLLSIFVPLSVGVGLFFGEFISNIKRIPSFFLIWVAIAGIVLLELMYFGSASTIGWRKTVTNQDLAVDYVIAHSKPGDRVFAVGDGTSFLLKMATLNKHIQVVNGASKLCPQSIQDSIEWAIADYGPQNLYHMVEVQQSNWFKRISFTNLATSADVYSNTKLNNPLQFNNSWEWENCPRLLRLGKNEISVFATPEIQEQIVLKEPLKIYLQGRIRRNSSYVAKELFVNPEDIAQMTHHEQEFRISIDQKRIDEQVFLSFDVPQGLKLKIRKIEIRYLGNN